MKKIRSFISRHRRAATVTLSVFLGLIVCVIILGFVPFSNNMLKSRVERILQESLNGRCAIGTLNITMWKGVILGNVRYESPDEPKGRLKLSCSFPRITMSYYLVPLLFKHLIINTMTFEKPAMTVTTPDPALAKKEQLAEFSLTALKQVLSTLPYTVLIRKISLNDAQATVNRDDTLVMSGAGIDLSLGLGFNHGIALEGRLTAKELTALSNCRFTECKASIKSNGMDVSLYDCRAAMYGGELSMKGSADLSINKLDTFVISLKDLNLEEWYRSSGQGKGSLTGTVNASATLDRSMLCVDSLKGKGWVKATSIATQGSSLQKSIMMRLVIPKLESLKFHKVYSDLVVSKGKIITKNFFGKGDPLDFTADGWFGMNGRLSERVEGVFSADFSRGLPDIVRNSLLPVEKDKDKRAFKCTVTGTLDRPLLEIDQRIVNRAVNNVFDAIGRLFRK
jgi:hypothetical protein